MLTPASGKPKANPNVILFTEKTWFFFFFSFVVPVKSYLLLISNALFFLIIECSIPLSICARSLFLFCNFESYYLPFFSFKKFHWFALCRSSFCTLFSLKYFFFLPIAYICSSTIRLQDILFCRIYRAIYLLDDFVSREFIYTTAEVLFVNYIIYQK